MKTATVRDLRTRFPFLEIWLKAGEEISITKHGLTVARLVPEKKKQSSAFHNLAGHFQRQRQKTWGDRVFSAAEVAEMEAAERKGHEHL